MSFSFSTNIKVNVPIKKAFRSLSNVQKGLVSTVYKFLLSLSSSKQQLQQGINSVSKQMAQDCVDNEQITEASKARSFVSAWFGVTVGKNQRQETSAKCDYAAKVKLGLNFTFRIPFLNN